MRWQPVISKISPWLAPWCERRKHVRLGFEGLFCDHGRIVNISLAGASILSSEPLAGTIEIHLHDAPANAMIEADVVWSKRVRRSLYETGVEFTNLSAEAIRLLEMIVSLHKRQNRSAS